MKTISSRFLKGALAMLLAVVMLFGTTLTGFAAVVDNADTSANVDVTDTGAQYNIYWQGHVYFLAPATWNIDTYKYIQVDITRTTSASSSNYQFYAGTMTRIGTSRLFYLKINADHRSWGQNEYITFTANSSSYGSGTFTLNTNHNYMVPLDYGVTNANGYYLFKPSSETNNSTTTNGNSMSGSYASSRDVAKAAQTVNITTDGASSADGGTVSLKGYYFSSDNAIAQSTATSSTTTETYEGAVQGSDMTLTATPKSGYKFVGWYNGSTLLSANTSYTYEVFNAKTITAKFETDGYSYTVTAGEGGTVNTTGGTGTSAAITATPSTGYEFAGWEVTGSGSVANASSASTTFTITGNGANAHATFVKKTYTVKFLDINGNQIGSTQTVEHGKTPTAPTPPAITGKTFAGWNPTVGAVTANTDYKATYTDNTYSITVNQNVSGGTVTLGKTSAKYGESVSISVTPPDNYKISSITGGGLNVTDKESWSGSFTMPAENVTINVTYVLAGTCAPHFAYGDQSLNLGATVTNTASTNEFCTGGATFTYKSSDTSVATVNASTGLVTAKKPGTTTITATCSCGTTATYKVTVKSPTVSVANMTLDVNGTATAAPTITNGPASGYTITYTAGNNGYFTVTAGGKVTALAPGSGSKVDFVMTYGGNQVASGSFSVAVNTPAYSVAPKAVTLITGQTMEDAFVTTADGNPEITFAAGSSDVISISGGKATALKAGLSTVRTSFKYNDTYTAVAIVNVTVVDPVITATPTSLNLEFGGGTQSGTVTVTTNADASEVTPKAVTVTSANANVATATLVGDKITITATGTGSTTVTAKFYDAEFSIPVNVTQYKDSITVYLYGETHWNKWDNDVRIYLFDTADGSVYDRVAMPLIGWTSSGNRVWAVEVPKTELPATMILTASNSWSEQTVNYALSAANGDQQAFYLKDWNSTENKANLAEATMDLILPSVSIPNVVVPISQTETVTATTNGTGLIWSIADSGSSIASVTGGTNNTATVTGKAVGDTELTVRAFVDTTSGCSMTSLNIENEAAWPYISSTATSTVTVGSVDYDITAYAAYSENGSDVTRGENGGTVSITVAGENLGTSAPVAHGNEYTLTAVAKEGYRFKGWVKDNQSTVSTLESYTATATAAAEYRAEFIKTHKVSVVKTAGIDTITFQGVEGATVDNITVDAGTTVTVTATPANGYKFTNWTVSGATVSDPTANPITITNIQSSLTLTPVAVPVYTATVNTYANKYLDNRNNEVYINDVVATSLPFANGETVIIKPYPDETCEFIGWYTDDTFKEKINNGVSGDGTYTTTMTPNGIDIVGLFAKVIYIRDIASVKLSYDVETNTYTSTLATYSADNNSFWFKEASEDGEISDISIGTVVGGELTESSDVFTFILDEENYYNTNIKFELVVTGKNQYTLNVTAQEKPKYQVTYMDGNTPIAIDKYAVDSQVVLNVNYPAGKYLSGATTAPATDLTFDTDKKTITFTMPNSDVVVTPQFTEYAYINFTDTTGLTLTGYKTAYKAGEAVDITVAPASSQVTIAGIDAPGLTVTKDGNNYKLTGTLTAGQTVTVTPTVDAKFKMNSEQIAIGNYGTGVNSGFGTVKMTVDGVALAEGGYVEKTQTVTYTASETHAEYTFAGFYSDKSCTQLITYDTTYTVTPTKDTTVYSLWARRQYMDFDSGATNSYVNELLYDKELGAYTLETTLSDGDSTATTIANGAWFQVTNDKNDWTSGTSYHHFEGTFAVTHNASGFDATISWNDGGDSWKFTTSSAAGTTIKFILTPTGNTAIDFSAVVGEIGDIVYLSSGRVDIPGSYNSAVFDAVSTFTTEGLTSTSHEVYNEGENREHYKKLNLTEAQTITFETELSGTAAADYYIDKYVVYHIDTETYTMVTPNTLGNNKYSGSAYVDGPCYIVPIYFHTEAYAEANSLVEIDIYFDATAISNTNWGPFVACYTWGSNGAEYTGGWSGQLMIPTEDGTSFYTMITVPSADAENATSIPQGVTFNNYMQSTVPGDNTGAFGIKNTQYQCYDYREPITLYEAGYDVITFVAKDSTDGYHNSESSDGSNALNPVSSTADITKFDFEYLYTRDGVTPMDLNGNAIENAPDLDTVKADYYIITRGDTYYNGNYEPDTSYAGKWSVDWYVFDSNGKFLTNILSTALWDDIDMDVNTEDGELYTYLHEALGTDAAGVAGKTVAISYEAPNNAPKNTGGRGDVQHQISYDGQWYGNMLDDSVTGNVLVGLVDGNNFNIDDDNIADYGEGYLVDAEGGKYASLEIPLDLGEANLSATIKDGYRFVGWYTQKADGSYVEISKATDYTTYINMNETYYAMFKEIGEGEVVINHLKYNNPDDPFIPSHGGVSEMYVEVIDKDGNVYSGTPSTSISTATFPAVEGQDYTIRITTTPLMNGEFFAWYTDSENADGTKTYEEILTLEEDVDKTTKVETEWTFTYDPSGLNVINIYSDVTRVSNKADLYYKYLNRFGEWRTYTVRDVELTDDECTGFVGNNYKEYYPTFLTLCTVLTPDGEEDEFYLEDYRIAEYEANGYTFLKTYNKIQALAPSAEVTEAFGEEVKWVITENNLTPTKSQVTLIAEQNTIEYTISYEVDGENGTVSGLYNDLMTLQAPNTNEAGEAFSYWEEEIENENGEKVWRFLSYQQNYNYRIVEDKNIRAVFGVTDMPEWNPTIDTVTYTREYQDTSDYIYTDFLLAYNSRDKVRIQDIKGEGNIKYGLILVRDASYFFTGQSDAPTFVDAASVKANLETVALAGTNKAISGNNYYCYDLTEEDLTIFNRRNHYLRYDNNYTTKNGNKYCEYAFTAVAYVVDDGEVFLSEPEFVNFWDLANKPVTELN